jgi:hypothetical protein
MIINICNISRKFLMNKHQMYVSIQREGYKMGESDRKNMIFSISVILIVKSIDYRDNYEKNL